MPRGKSTFSGWQGTVLVAITYVHFLIFAQFAFLKRMASLGIADAHLKAVMAAMAFGGILFSLLVPRVWKSVSPHACLRLGLLVSSVAAFSTLLPLTLAASFVVAFVIGVGLAVVTVTIVTFLPVWTGGRDSLFKVALGTGLGYFLCNFPPLFTASPEAQAITAGVLCLVGIVVTLAPAPEPGAQSTPEPREPIPFVLVLIGFTALVWLDSAAFFIIQNSAALKAVTWQGSLHLWMNGTLHLWAALAAAFLLRRRGLSFTLAAAFCALAAACLLLLDPRPSLLASIFYPIGVSLYSVALVAYPSLLAPSASAGERGRRAGWLYAVAGWIGSAMGIGMGQNLGHVPAAFIVAAGLGVLSPLLIQLFRHRRREVVLTVLLAIVALHLDRGPLSVKAHPALSQVERGRKVYISEGCIHCHSQYVRPNSPDVLMWGPVESIADLRAQHPPLIGNRRQGPDLTQVGLRRSPLWLKAHFCNPAEVSGSSIMPTFCFLFNDSRGDDLVAYLASLHGQGSDQHIAEISHWQPSQDAWTHADAALGERIYHQRCATCHASDGQTRLAWESGFKRLPPDLATGPYFRLSPADAAGARLQRLARITKFGIPGTDMPGHEYLSDHDITSVAVWLSQIIAQPTQQQ
jgi:cytochrome c oxidase cbb3-type subunit 2